MRLRVATMCFVLLSALIGGLPALAQSTNAPPVLVMTDTPFDPSTVSVASDGDKGYLATYVQTTKTMTGNSVLTIGANLVGVTYYFSSASSPSTIADTARVALELCEFNDKAPCIILSINGKDARMDGAWPPQPQMLVKTPGSKFDPWTIPFNPQFNRAIGGYLASSPTPIAVVVSNAVGWTSSSGATILEAIDAAFASCAKTYPGNACVLYSVNGTVVMAQ